MCFGAFCLSGLEITLIAGVVLLFLVVIGYAVVHSLGNKETDGIQTIDMTFQQSVPDTGSYDTSEEEVVDEDEEFDHPYPVGTKTFAGEYESLGARLEVMSYDEEEMKVHCRLWVEAPAGATDVVVDHTWEGDDNDLGAALVNYTLNGQGHFATIDLFNDDLNDSDYQVVIKVGQSTFEDITK